MCIVWDGKISLMDTDGESLVRLPQPAGVVDVACCHLHTTTTTAASATTDSARGRSGQDMDVSNKGDEIMHSQERCGSGSGYRIVLGRDDGVICVLDAATLETQAELVAHDDIVSRLCPLPSITSISSNSNSSEFSGEFASVGWDGLLCLWRLEEGADPVSTYRTPGVQMYDVAASPLQRNLLSTVGNDSFIRLWDSRTLGDGCSTLVDLGQIGTSCAFSSANDYHSVVGLLTGHVSLIDWRMPDVVFQESLHKARISRLRTDVSTPGRFVSASDDGFIALFSACVDATSSADNNSGALDVSLLKAHDDYVTDVVINDGFVYSCSVDKTIRKHPL